MSSLRWGKAVTRWYQKMTLFTGGKIWCILFMLQEASGCWWNIPVKTKLSPSSVLGLTVAFGKRRNKKCSGFKWLCHLCSSSFVTLSVLSCCNFRSWDSSELMRLFDSVIFFRKCIIPSLVSSWCTGCWSLPPESLGVSAAAAKMSKLVHTVTANWSKYCVPCKKCDKRLVRILP